jgi:hypothetical protein
VGPRRRLETQQIDARSPGQPWCQSFRADGDGPRGGIREQELVGPAPGVPGQPGASRHIGARARAAGWDLVASSATTSITFCPVFLFYYYCTNNIQVFEGMPFC